MAPPPGHSATERGQALDHLGYEMWMLAAAAARLPAASADRDCVGANAYLESALMHARALIDFFLMDSRFDSDIRRTDFAEDWDPAPRSAVERLNAHYVLLHKYLAHLTWERVSEAAPSWNYPDIATDVLDVADAWAKHLAPVDRPAWEVVKGHIFVARQGQVR